MGSNPTAIDAQEVIPTTTPVETLQRCIDFFQRHHAHRPLRALGVGMFGPVDLHPDSTTYGFITSTPKAGWGFTDIVGPLQRALNIPVGWENDVNAAAIGEARWGAARGCDPAIYLTVGTGVGGGVIAGGRVLHGLIHPEMGHVLLP
ncbi:MAG: ROK family protein, partial [Chloroflexi bacterium]|nr:ROK family protein [Chloroflexota bacterium]